MRNLVVLVLITGCGLLYVYAQKPVPAAGAKPHAAKQASTAKPAGSQQASAEQVRKLLDMLQIRDNLQITLDAMKNQMQRGSEAMLRERVPQPTPDQLKQVDDIVQQEFDTITMDDLIRDVVPIYQRHLTKSDVEALLAFYSSPVGQKLRREEPAMMRESMEATSAGQRQKMEDLLARVEVRLQQFIDQQSK
ncbi:MAG: DUF2059 domain-containing protein [Actinomycetota bacterium]